MTKCECSAECAALCVATILVVILGLITMGFYHVNIINFIELVFVLQVTLLVHLITHIHQLKLLKKAT